MPALPACEPSCNDRSILAIWGTLAMDAGTVSFDVKSLLQAQPALIVSHCAPKQTVFAQGTPANTVFYIERGKVKVTVVSEFDKEAIVAIQSPGEFCGEECLTGQPLRLTTVTAITDCTLFELPKHILMELIHSDREFSEFFLARLLTRTSQLHADLVSQLFNSTEKRLARALLILANIGREDRPQKLPSIVNETTLASLIGTTPARIRIFLNKFKELGFIAINDGFEVNGSLLNVVLFDRPHVEADDTP